MMKKTLLAIALTAFGVTAAHADYKYTTSGPRADGVAIVTQAQTIYAHILGNTKLTTDYSRGTVFYDILIGDKSGIEHEPFRWGVQISPNNGLVTANTNNMLVCQDGAEVKAGSSKCVELEVSGGDYEFDQASTNNKSMYFVGKTQLLANATPLSHQGLVASAKNNGNIDAGNYHIFAYAQIVSQ